MSQPIELMAKIIHRRITAAEINERGELMAQ